MCSVRSTGSTGRRNPERVAGSTCQNFKSISVDLIYGLPHQNIISFNRTLERVISANPDRISIYNYAHLPGLFKPHGASTRLIYQTPRPVWTYSNWQSKTDRGWLSLYWHGSLCQTQ